MRPQKQKRRKGVPLVNIFQGYQSLNALTITGILTGNLVKVKVPVSVAFLMQSCDIGEPDSSTVDMTLPLQIRRKQPWPEQLQLSLDDALIAHYILDFLTVMEPNSSTPLTAQDLWRRCITDGPCAGPHAAQLLALKFHYRSSGWFVRQGLDFGAHFVLYNGHPAEVHAEFCVVVRTAMPGGPDSLMWRDLAITNRVNIQVRKMLLIVSVLYPPDMDLTTPDCAKLMKIDERRVSRWTVVDDSKPP